MEEAPPLESVAYIGETAGTVWRVLSENGPLSVTRLLKAVDEPRDTVMQALGWLARENKLSIEDEGRTRIVSLVG
jgi:hypothetical protein